RLERGRQQAVAEADRVALHADGQRAGRLDVRGRRGLEGGVERLLRRRQAPAQREVDRDLTLVVTVVSCLPQQHVRRSPSAHRLSKVPPPRRSDYLGIAARKGS